MRHCAGKGRLKDSNSSADYYVAWADSDWTVSSKPKYLFCDVASGAYPTAYASIRIASNKASRSNEYAATPSRSWSSSSSVSLSFGIGPASISTNLSGSSSAKVTRTTYTSTQAAWSVTPSRLSKVSVAFSQAVAQGSVPKYTVTMTRPLYALSKTVTKPGTCKANWHAYNVKVKSTAVSGSQTTFTR